MAAGLRASDRRVGGRCRSEVHRGRICVILRCRPGCLSRNLEVAREGDEEAEMLYLWGPGLETEVSYRRAELGKAAGARTHWRRRVRQAVAAAGRDRPRPW